MHPKGGCGIAAHGTYLRKYPVPHYIARAYCKKGHTTFGLIPDFLASHVPGTLDEIEEAALAYESTKSIYKAAEAIRPITDMAEDEEPITLAATSQWIRRRVLWVKAALLAASGLFPNLFVDCEKTVSAFRACLHTESALMALRGICSDRLDYLPYPVGFGPRSKFGKPSIRGLQQSMRSDRPP